MAEKKKLHPNYKRAKDKELVRGIFRFHELPGGRLSFRVRFHKGDPIQSYTLQDGEVYKLPLEVARHLSNNVAYPTHDQELDEQGRPIRSVVKKVPRCTFESLQFIDIEELSDEEDSMDKQPA